VGGGGKEGRGDGDVGLGVFVSLVAWKGGAENWDGMIKRY